MVVAVYMQPLLTTVYISAATSLNNILRNLCITFHFEFSYVNFYYKYPTTTNLTMQTESSVISTDHVPPEGWDGRALQGNIPPDFSPPLPTQPPMSYFIPLISIVVFLLLVTIQNPLLPATR